MDACRKCVISVLANRRCILIKLFISDIPQEDASRVSGFSVQIAAIFTKSSIYCGELWLVAKIFWVFYDDISEVTLSMLIQLEALLHPFFDELRDPNARLPNGKSLPPLFNFKPPGEP